jgi:hypothetical protein
MPVELVEDRVPRCEPWSKAAKGLEFTRLPMNELVARQDAFRKQFRRGSSAVVTVA